MSATPDVQDSANPSPRNSVQSFGVPLPTSVAASNDDKAKLRVVVKEFKRLKADLEQATQQLTTQQETIVQLQQQLEAEKRERSRLDEAFQQKLKQEQQARSKAEEQLQRPGASNQMAVLQDRVTALQHDCDSYKTENAKLTEEVTKLREENAVLHDSLEVLNKQVVQLSDKVDETSVTAAHQRTQDQIKEDAKFRETFKLTTDQFIIASYPCSYGGWLSHGILYVAPKCICFGTGKKDSQSLVLLYSEIKAVEKTQGAIIKFGIAKSIAFTMADDTQHVFSGFSHRGTTLRDICAQAKLCGAPWVASIKE